MPETVRQQKITFGEMRKSGVHGVLIYCADYKCSHSTAISADRWPGDVRLSESNRGSLARLAATGVPTCARISVGKRSGPGEDQMSMILKLLTLGLAATTLSSPIPQRHINYGIVDSYTQRITQLWLVTYLNETGIEVVAQARLTNGDYAPLIAADVARLESMMPAARELARTSQIKMRLIKFTDRLDIEEIVP
jgi:hypothetical protein